MKNDMLGHLLLEGRFLGHILELWRIRRKRLYILQEINPRWLQMKKCFFMKNWGWNEKHQVKVNFWSCTSSFWRKYERKRINVRAFSTLRIGLSCHMRSTFEERVFQQKNGFQKIWWFWDFLEGGLGCFRRDFDEFVSILAWNRDGKWWEGPN